MSTESQNAQVEQKEDLFAKFWNEGLTQEQVDKGFEQAPAPEAAAPEVIKEPEVTETETAPAEETKQPEAAATQTPPSQSPETANDWLASLPEAARKQVEALAQRNQALERQWSEQVSKNRKLHNEVTNLQKKVTQPTATDVRTQEEVDEDWKKLEEADPVLAKILKKQADQLRQQFQREAEEKARQYVEPIYQEQHHQYMSYQQEILTQYVPNWRDIVNDPYFQAWKDNSSDGIKALYGSSDARDSIRVLQLYANDMQAIFGQADTPQQQAAPQQAAAPTAPAPTPKVVQDRQAKLERSAPVQAQPAAQVRQAQLTPEQLYEKFYSDPNAILGLLAKQNS